LLTPERLAEIRAWSSRRTCASFSTAGKRDKAWGQVKKYSDVEQRTDDLFDEYIRLVDQIRPKVFVAENVEGLMMGIAAKGNWRTRSAATFAAEKRRKQA
jgi:DNA (cytosine-5)-methyltransferase 1